VANDSSVTKYAPAAHTVDSKTLDVLMAGLAANTHLTELHLKGCGVNTKHAEALAKALEANSTLKKIDLESNRIEPAGIKAIARALRQNKAVTEIRLVNQHVPFGNDAETELAGTQWLDLVPSHDPHVQ
jgi:Ran GTPase-activating protein (RanGAP) involved in mRNA processing and transport